MRLEEHRLLAYAQVPDKALAKKHYTYSVLRTTSQRRSRNSKSALITVNPPTERQSKRVFT